MKFLILNFFIKALLNATYEINPIDYSHKTVAHYNTYHTSITEWSILKPLITVLRTWYILPVHYISVQYSHSNSTPYMDTPNCPVMQIWLHGLPSWLALGQGGRQLDPWQGCPPLVVNKQFIGKTSSFKILT